MSATSHPGLALSKGKPKLLLKREAAAQVQTQDRTENAKVKARSSGQCEVIVVTAMPSPNWEWRTRCNRRASHVHHLIAGSGRRNKAGGRSILAESKLHVCDRDHSEIHGHVLQPQGTQAEREAAATIRYTRVK